MDIKKLEDRVDELISTVERLRSENKTLRDSQTNLINERESLIRSYGRNYKRAVRRRSVVIDLKPEKFYTP